MSAQGQNVVRDLFIGSAEAAETTLTTFRASASAGELGVFESDGTAAAGVSEFIVVGKGLDGELKVSSKIKPSEITRFKAFSYVPETQGSVTLNPTAPTAGDTYEVRIRIMNVGSLSVQNFYIKHSMYKAKAGDNESDLVDGLIAALNRDFSREAYATATTNPYFTFTKGSNSQTITVDTAPDTNNDATVTINGTAITVSLLAADDADGAATKIAAAIDAEDGFSASATNEVVTYTVDNNGDGSASFADGGTNAAVTIADVASSAMLIITAKAPEVKLGKKDGRGIEFVADLLDISNEVEFGSKTVTGYKPGRGTGRQVAILEFFSKGNYGDIYREIGYPNNFDRNLDASLSNVYHLIEIDLAASDRDAGFTQQTVSSQLTIAVQGASFTEVNKIINKLETVTGLTQADLS